MAEVELLNKLWEATYIIQRAVLTYTCLRYKITFLFSGKEFYTIKALKTLIIKVIKVCKVFKLILPV